jgi:2-polyprenyl-3-methyl-5-hydroxy-6-metoxy-1,4-benzoquinol methylase
VTRGTSDDRARREAFNVEYLERIHSAFDEDRIRRMARRLPKDATSVLDVGCGLARNLPIFAEALPAARIVGADIAPNAVEAARRAGFEGVLCDAGEQLPFDAGSFDVVTCGEVIEHMIETDGLLDEIHRVLKPDGSLILTTPNLAYVPNRVLLFLGIQPLFTETSLHRNMGRVVKWLGQGNGTQGHLKIFTLPALEDLLLDRGFIIDRIEGYRFIHRGPAAPIDALLCLKPSFAAGFIVCARPSPQA